MSTKRADGKPYDAGALFTSRYRQDVTCDYKYDEGNLNSLFFFISIILHSVMPDHDGRYVNGLLGVF